jgi:hypothetical protein
MHLLTGQAYQLRFIVSTVVYPEQEDPSRKPPYHIDSIEVKAKSEGTMLGRDVMMAEAAPEASGPIGDGMIPEPRT